MESDKGLAMAIFYWMDTYRSINAMQKLFILWMKDEIRYVTGENLLNEMMRCKPIKITRIK